MRHGKVLILLVLLGTVVSCATKNKIKEETQAPSLYDLPETVDYQKAAKFNIELGLNYLKQDQIARAKSKLTRARTLAPHLPEVHYSYAYLLERVGEIENAEKSYRKAISLHSKGGNEHNNYGAFLCRQHSYKQAEKEFLIAIADPDYMNTGEAFENAGLCVMQIPDVAKATEYFEKALRYDPNRPNALIELAIFYYNNQKLARAQEYYSRFVQLSHPTARSLLLGIELAKNEGDKNKEASYRLLLNAQYPDVKLEDSFRISTLAPEKKISDIKKLNDSNKVADKDFGRG